MQEAPCKFFVAALALAAALVAVPAGAQQDDPLALWHDPAIPRFNWGAFFMPPIWGVWHNQWAGVFFLPAWAFVDNVIRGEQAWGVWTGVLGWTMFAATIALQVVYARNANRIAWSRVKDTLSVSTPAPRKRAEILSWALARESFL